MNKNSISKFKAAFSLVELLIVIAIIGILTAVAMPLYTEYMVKSRISKALALKNYVLKKEMETIVRTGTVSAGYSEVYNKNNVHYRTLGTHASAGNFLLMLEFNIDGLTGIPEFSLNGPGEPNCEGVVGSCGAGAKNRVCVRVKITDTGSAVEEYCGQCRNHLFDIPLKYLPSNCQCENLHEFGTVDTIIPANCKFVEAASP